MDTQTANKALIIPLRAAMYDFTEGGVTGALAKLSEADALFRLGHPIGDNIGPENHYQAAYHDLHQAWPDLERRDTIVIAGPDEDGAEWVGCCGYYTGTFIDPWLDIPPTGHQVAMRFHEFYRIEDAKIVELQALWDIPEVMMQAGAWPMAPSLGCEWQVPGPATCDGHVTGTYDATGSDASRQHILEMLSYIVRHPDDSDPNSMELSRFWHPRLNWYGPAGIGTSRGISGFRNWHQIPFLNAMPDRGRDNDIIWHLFADGDYAAVTGWPNMKQSITDSGWLGIAPSGQEITLRSLDFWRLEHGLIRENWVLIDLLDVYHQIGVDVFARLREFNKARNLAPIEIPDGMSVQ